MAWLYFVALGPVLAGIVLALTWWLVRGRKRGLPRFSMVSAFMLAAGVSVLLGGMARSMIGTGIVPIQLPMEFWSWYMDYRFTLPLLLGIFGMVLLAFPIRTRSGRGLAELTPRTPLSFARLWWFVAPAIALVVVLIITVVAGVASQPDPETGRYMMYFVDLGGERSMGTSIYGWYYSVPSLLLAGVLILITTINLFLIARPPLSHDHEEDWQIRTVRTRSVLALGTGSLLLHLGVIIGSLAGTASVRSSFPTSEGTVSFWLTFAALEPVFVVAANIVAILGFALWVAMSLSAAPSRRWVPAKGR